MTPRSDDLTGGPSARQVYESLTTCLHKWDGRRRRQELWRWLPRGLLAGLLVGFVVALLSRQRPLLMREELAFLGLATALIGASLAGLVVLLRRRPLVAQALFADRQFGLRERMTTAVEIRTGRLTVDDDIATRQLNDALAVAATVDTARQLPVRPRSSDWLPVLALALVFGLVLWLPNPQEAALIEQRAVAEAVAQETATLETLAADIAADDTLTPEQATSLTRPIDEALAALDEPAISRESAVAALSQAEREMQALSQEFDNTALNDALAEAAASLENHEATAGLADALQAGQLSQAAAATAALADGVGDLTDVERAELAEHLAEAADKLRDADAELAATLEQAAEALTEGDTTAAQAALDKTAAQLAERGQTAPAAAQAARAAEQLGAARSEVAQSGSGNSGEGETAGTGEGPAASGGSGGSTGGSSAAGGQDGGTGGSSQGGGHVENVFIPPPANLEGQGQNLELEAQCLADPAACGPLAGQSPSTTTGQASGGGLVPYDRVFSDYRDAAFEALGTSDIPPGLQDLVRAYFTALEP